MGFSCSIQAESCHWFCRSLRIPVVLLLFLGTTAHAADACEPVVGRLASTQGNVEVQRGQNASWARAKQNDVLCEGDSVRAAERSRAAIALANQAVLRVDQNTAIRLINIGRKPEEKSLVDLLRGAIQSFSRKPRRLEVSTPYLNGTIEGTEFVIRVADNQTTLTVFEGTVRASNNQGMAAVSGGQSVVAAAGQAPQPRTIVRPRDAAQWALYYPPVLAGAASDPTLQQAVELLSVGRVDEARTTIDRALAQSANAGLSRALSAVIAVVQNDRDQALSEGRKAVELAPDSAASYIALSYAHQASFDLPAARGVLLEAVKRQPNEALAWARLAELHLMLGQRDEAITSARKSASLSPTLGRSQAVLGFAALASFDTDEAIASFEMAIAAEPADPLPRLGLGLARIHRGKLQEGRGDLELAVGLDSNNALLRAYLGKAYFEERRAGIDAQQFQIARELDPQDPTAFLYDAIRKQTENRPVEALQDVEDSIARNDNRAVYRSRQLLDKDRAARGTSLARVYSDLGFSELGISESTGSLVLDPADASAHRFLSDAYQNVRRREIARVSELLQAQMLQDININPVQPSLSEANLNIVTLGGPANAGFNEFTPLFQRNQVQANVAGYGGSNGTAAGEAVVSSTLSRYSFSIGAFGYQTDGWRANNDLDQQVYNAFLQVAVTDKLNMQVEVQHRDSKEGDLTFNFNPDDFSLLNKKEREQDIVRVGLRYSMTPYSHILLSAIHSDYEVRLNDTDTTFLPFDLIFYDKTRTVDSGNQLEAQYIHQGEGFNFIVGAADTKIDRRYEFLITGTDLSVPVDFVVLDTTANDQFRHPRAYLYANINAIPTMNWTLGVSHGTYEEGTLEEKSTNPKLGVQWNVTNNLRLRAAAFRVVKPALANNRTLEPTQVAGFNQLYDDINGTKSETGAVGIDWRISRNLAVGAEYTSRNMEEPIYDNFLGNWISEDRQEKNSKLYLYWTPMKQLAVRAELTGDRYTSDAGIDFELPLKVVTNSLPVGITYFGTSGLFVGATATYVDQEVQRSVFATKASGDDQFTVVDAAIGYRFAKRRGIVSLGVKNLFDRRFHYQDDSYREFRTEPSVGPYFPVRTVLGRVALTF